MTHPRSLGMSRRTAQQTLGFGILVFVAGSVWAALGFQGAGADDRRVFEIDNDPQSRRRRVHLSKSTVDCRDWFISARMAVRLSNDEPRYVIADAEPDAHVKVQEGNCR